MELTSLISRALPWSGVLAFSLCSTWAVYHWFAGQAVHPSPLLWIPAVMVELVTAWAVGQVVGQVRELTRSNISKQDRRFRFVLFGVLLAVTAPMLSVSIVSNAAEYGSVWTGAVFPLASVTCAIGAAIPTVEAKWVQAKARKRQANKIARQAAREAAKRQKRLASFLATNETARAVLEQYRDNPMLTQATVADNIGVSRATVGNYLSKLAEMEIIEQNGRGVEVVID